jgi:hypothetical protein
MTRDRSAALREVKRVAARLMRELDEFKREYPREYEEIFGVIRKDELESIRMLARMKFKLKRKDRDDG